jgi:hypothetical protein
MLIWSIRMLRSGVVRHSQQPMRIYYFFSFFSSFIQKFEGLFFITCFEFLDTCIIKLFPGFSGITSGETKKQNDEFAAFYHVSLIVKGIQAGYEIKNKLH